jgi:hypothetical protein
LALGIHGFSATPPAGASPAAPAAKSPTPPADNPESALKQDMSADQVRQIMGEPKEVNPMKAPSGKAEVWVFRRLVNERMDRIPVASIPIMVTVVSADGKAHQQQTGETTQYGDVRIATEVTVELLMFNDHYVTHKVSTREVKSYR